MTDPLITSTGIVTYQPLPTIKCRECGAEFTPTLADDDALCDRCWFPLWLARMDAICALLDARKEAA